MFLSSEENRNYVEEFLPLLSNKNDFSDVYYGLPSADKAWQYLRNLSNEELLTMTEQTLMKYDQDKWAIALFALSTLTNFKERGKERFIQAVVDDMPKIILNESKDIRLREWVLGRLLESEEVLSYFKSILNEEQRWKVISCLGRVIMNTKFNVKERSEIIVWKLESIVEEGEKDVERAIAFLETLKNNKNLEPEIHLNLEKEISDFIELRKAIRGRNKLQLLR